MTAMDWEAILKKPDQNSRIKSVHDDVQDLIRDPGDLEKPGSPFLRG
jgi:hypothetical protein